MSNTNVLLLCVNGRSLSFVPENDRGSGDAIRLCAPCFGGEIRVEMPFGIFSADALCAAAFILATRRGERQRCVVMAESSGLQGVVPVMVEPDTGKTAAGLPVPEVFRMSDSLKLGFPGMLCFVGSDLDFPQDTDGAVLLVERDEFCESVSARAKLRDGLPPTALSASGLAAAAAAIDHAAMQPDGITEYEVGMGDRMIGIGVVMRGGQLEGLSVSSVVAWDGDANSNL